MRSGWITDKLKRHMQQFETRVHQELLNDARRPIDSLTPEYLDGLRERMALAHRFTNGCNNHPMRSGDGEELY